MSVEVHVPIRLRVSPAALADHPDRIERAVAKAVGRAMAHSRSALHDALGDYLPPHYDRPEFSWSGKALKQVLPATRAHTEKRLADAIRRSTLVRAPHAPSADGPLARDPAERFNPRNALPLGRYRIATYEDGSERAVPVADADGKRAKLPMMRGWERSRVYDDYGPAFVRKKARDEADRQGVALGQAYALLVRDTGDFGWTLILTADDFRTPGYMQQFSPPKKRRVTGVEKTALRFAEELLVPPLTHAVVTEIPLASDFDARVEQLHQLKGGLVAAELRNDLDPATLKEDLVLSDEELDAIIIEAVEDEIRQQATECAGKAFLLRIDWGDVRFDIAIEQSIAAQTGWNGTNPTIVIPAVGMLPGQLFGAGGEKGSGGRSARGDGGEPGRGSRYGTMGDGPGEEGSGRVFPSLGGGSTMCCEPFLDAEPSLDELPGRGAMFRRLIAEIAERLDMVPCDYAATFCIGAADVLVGHSRAVGMVAGYADGGEMTLPHDGRKTGNLGHAEFRPHASRGIQLCRRLAQAAAKISQLRRLIVDFYLNGEGRYYLKGDYALEHISFARKFHEEAISELREGVGEIFAQTCQIVMLQLLDTSARQIAARQRNIHAYAPIFREVMIRNLSDIGTLTKLRDRLAAFERAQAVTGALNTSMGIGASAVLPEWSAAARALSAAITSTEGFAHMPGPAQDIVTEKGISRIRDDHGFLWTRDALEQTIAQQRGGAESMDPLIQQLSDIPDNVEKFRRDPSSAETMLTDLLAEMSRLNADKRQEAAMDLRFGLRVGRISDENVHASTVPGLLFDLAGVHKLAHEQISPFFGSEIPIYADGISHIFAVELGRAGLEHFAVFTGLVLLAVVCAPAAFVAGVAVAGAEVVAAQGRRDLYKALINPELVLNRTEVELECYIAYVGLALALLPEAGTAAKALSVGVRGAARKGVGVGLQLAARSVVRRVSRQVTEQLAQELLPALIREFATNLLMEQVIVPAVVGPVIAAVERELRVRMSVGGVAGAEALIAQIEHEAAERSKQPLAGGMGKEEQ